MKHVSRFLIALVVLLAALPLIAQDDGEAQFVDIPGESTFPEGIITAPDGTLYVTGFGNGSILQITDGTEVSEFRASGEDGLASAVGMAIDEERNRLWVANFNFDGFNSNVLVYDLESGELIADIAEADDAPHFFNELAIDANGRIYISDTMAPIIWTVDEELGAVEIFAQDDLLANPDPERPFGLNGLAITEDGNYLIASVMDRLDQGDGRLVSIDLETAEVSDVELTGDEDVIASFGGSDGMFFEDGLLWMVNVTPPAAIITAEFNDDFSSAELVARAAFQDVYNRPTASAVRDGRLWTVNSQLDHIIDDGNGAVNTPPELPFQIVSVPLEGLLAEDE